MDRIPSATAMDAITLHVGDLDVMTAFYRDVVSLDVLNLGAPAEHQGRAGSATVTLGRRGSPLVVLRHTPGLPAPSRREAGLFHTAILFPTRAGLAAAVASMAVRAPETFTGSADHLVSQAFYFTDPEGNGIELYWDRTRDEWQWIDGQVQMGSLRLDPQAFLGEHLTEQGRELPQEGAASVGHIHLQVGDVEVARTFYVDGLGFDVMLDWHGALFVAAGGYHHHLAMNTWNSAGAGPRSSSLGLGEVAITLPSADDLGALGDRMRHLGVTARDDGASLAFEDPWSNLIRVTAA